MVADPGDSGAGVSGWRHPGAGPEHRQHGDCGRAGADICRFYLWGAGRWRRAAIFAGGVLSALVSRGPCARRAADLRRSPCSPGSRDLAGAVRRGRRILEGAITVAVVEALESIQPISRAAAARRAGRRSGGGGSGRGCCWAPWACSSPPPAPDGIQKLGLETGIAARARALFSHAVFGLPGGVSCKAAGNARRPPAWRGWRWSMRPA